MNISEELHDAFETIDMKSALRIAFGKCPQCNDRLVTGLWLQWCENRRCQSHIGPKNAPSEVREVLDEIKARSDAPPEEVSAVLRRVMEEL